VSFEIKYRTGTGSDKFFAEDGILMMGLFGKSKKKKPLSGPPMDVAWVKSPKGLFYNFLNLEPDEQYLMGKTGVFVIWLGGH
jgi:hypothetical protein